MPYLSQDDPALSTKDLLSWSLDDPQYDTSKPLWIDADDPSRSISGDEARTLIRKLVAGFRYAGLKPGDAVCIASYSEIYYSVLVLGIIAAGCVFTGTNPSYTPLELEHHLRASRAQMVICEPELLPPILATSVGSDLLSLHNITPRILVFDHHTHPSAPLTTHPSPTDLPSHPSWRTLLHHGTADWHRFDSATTSASTTAMLLFSSGTSGLPKPVPISHANLIAQHEHALYYTYPSPSSSSSSSSLPPPFSAPPTHSYTSAPPWPIRRLSFLAPFHAAVAPSTHTSPLKSGDPTFVLRRFDVPSFLRAVAAHAITDFLIVPPCVLAVVQAAKKEEEEEEEAVEKEGALRDLARSLASVRWVRVGAAPLGIGVQRAFQRLLDRATRGRGVLTQCWAMTETSCLAMQWGPGSRDKRVDGVVEGRGGVEGLSGSVGWPIVGLDVKVVDEEGREVEEEEAAVGGVVRGELCVRGPTVVRGYLGEDEALRRDEWDEDGFFRTGDIVVRVAETGLWYVVDRKKELIKVRGFQVAPPEIEAVLLAHPDVVDAAVIGIFDGTLQSELPRAYLVKRERSMMTEEDAKKWVVERLAKYKCLDGGVVFLKAIPKTASGKILKRVLRERAKQEMGREVKL